MKPKSVFVPFKQANAPAPWAVTELAHPQLPDARLRERAQILLTQFGRQPTATIPQACGAWGDVRAAYRFCDNERIEPQALLAAHQSATVARLRGQTVVLAVQDTTTLNYATHPDTTGLGPIGNNRDKTVGLHLHSTLALSPNGHPWGLLAAQVYARDPEQFGRGRTATGRNRTPVQAKESQRWLESLRQCQGVAAQCPDTQLVNVADREGDIYEVFFQALAPGVGPRVEVLVRAQHDRGVVGEPRTLWAFLSALPRAGWYAVRVPRQPGRAARQARLEIRFGAVTLSAPRLKEEQPALPLWAIGAREPQAPAGVEPILWRLVTTLPVGTLAEAIEKVRWYTVRWQIEALHKILKSGCRIEQRQLQTADRLERVLMLDLIVAWRLLLLSKVAREQPQEPANAYLLDEEWQVLWCYLHGRAPPPEQAPTLREAVHWIAQLGGFLARKSDGEPGPIVLWRGWQRLQDLVRFWNALKEKDVGNA